MPCHRCGARQADPVRGSSPWKRGVRDERQVLVCPYCQSAHDWTADLDQCVKCGSTALVCRLGDIECRGCGHTRPARRETDTDYPVAARAPGLSEEVAAALTRILNPGPGDRAAPDHHGIGEPAPHQLTGG
jgi:hypothetical protein